MPKYDYVCTACDTVFEVTRSMTSTATEHCPACGEIGKRVFTPVGVAFKGSGFHNTDYRPRPKDDTPPAPACPAKDSTSPKCSGCKAGE